MIRQQVNTNEIQFGFMLECGIQMPFLFYTFPGETFTKKIIGCIRILHALGKLDLE